VSVVRALNGLKTEVRADMEQALKGALGDLKLTAPLEKAVWTALSERDTSAPVVLRKDGKPEPDPEMRDVEHVPLDRDVDEHFAQEVKPFDELAWSDATDAKIGYELPLTRLFYRERPVRALQVIERDLSQLEEQVTHLRAVLADQREVALAHALQDRPRNARLGFVGRWLSGGTPARDDPANWAGDLPWASSKDLHAERLTDTIEHVTEDAALAGSRIVEPGTLFIATRGMSLAKRLPMALVMKRMAFNQDLKAIVPASEVDGEYLRLVLRAFEPEVLSLTVEAAHGTKRIETHTLKAFRLPLPDLDEQQQIVQDTLAVEDTLFALDACLLQERELLAEHRHALISAAVAGSDQTEEVSPT